MSRFQWWSPPLGPSVDRVPAFVFMAVLTMSAPPVGLATPPQPKPVVAVFPIEDARPPKARLSPEDLSALTDYLDGMGSPIPDDDRYRHPLSPT